MYVHLRMCLCVQFKCPPLYVRLSFEGSRATLNPSSYSLLHAMHGKEIHRETDQKTKTMADAEYNKVKVFENWFCFVMLFNLIKMTIIILSLRFSHSSSCVCLVFSYSWVLFFGQLHFWLLDYIKSFHLWFVVFSSFFRVIIHLSSDCRFHRC